MPLLLLLLLPAALAVFVAEPPVGAVVTDEIFLVAAAPVVSSALRRRRGRPRKFSVPSRAVTLTLPETVIAALSTLNHDLSRAVVRLAQRQPPAQERKPAELLVFGSCAVITIRPTPSLESRAGVQLVPLPDGRALISFDNPQTVAELELTIDDALEDPRLLGKDRSVFEGISAILKDARRSSDVSLHRRNIIVLQAAARRAQANGGKSASRKSHSRTAATAR